MSGSAFFESSGLALCSCKTRHPGDKFPQPQNVERLVGRHQATTVLFRYPRTRRDEFSWNRVVKLMSESPAV
jgi:hypothetical protein